MREGIDRAGLALLLCTLAAGCSLTPTTPPLTEGEAASHAAPAAAPEMAPETRSEAEAPTLPLPVEPQEVVELPAADPDEELAPAEPVTAAAHDELERAEPELSPEELERGLQLVEQGPATFDIPMVHNDQVLAWLDYYGNRNAETFAPGLARSGRYLPMFREIFAEAGLPRDLVYMAHVESAYKTHAYSRARAKGIFQFISGTARRYGLRVDFWIDERSDPEKSARAAAAYLKDLHAEFGDWYLALAAYNAGEGKIRRAIDRTGSRDFWKIARTRHIRRETKNYVPAVLAAALISKEPHKYGFEVEAEPPLEYETVVVDGAADLRVLARCAGVDDDTLRALNPALRRGQTPPDARTDVRVPPGSGATTLSALEVIPAGERIIYSLHPVRRGDTLSAIARRYGSSVHAIQQANRLGRSTLIRPGQTLKVPTTAAASYGGPADPEPWDGTVDETGRVTHVVRRGDTLWAIARRYGTTPQRVADQNRISLHATLRVGQKLIVAPAGGRVAQTSALDALTHTVRRGDSLWSIATLYRTTVEALCALNRISPRDVLYPGTKLTIR